MIRIWIIRTKVEHGHSYSEFMVYGFMQHLEFTETVCVTRKHLQIHVEVVSGGCVW